MKKYPIILLVMCTLFTACTSPADVEPITEPPAEEPLAITEPEPPKPAPAITISELKAITESEEVTLTRDEKYFLRFVYEHALIVDEGREIFEEALVGYHPDIVQSVQNMYEIADMMMAVGMSFNIIIVNENIIVPESLNLLYDTYSRSMTGYINAGGYIIDAMSYDDVGEYGKALQAKLDSGEALFIAKSEMLKAIQLLVELTEGT